MSRSAAPPAKRSMSAAGSRFAADHMPTWTPSQLEEGRSFIDIWRQQGLDVDLARLTYTGEYRHVPQYLAACGWETVERKVADLFSAIGLAGRWRGGSEEEAIAPRYVTAIRGAALSPAGMHRPARR